MSKYLILLFLMIGCMISCSEEDDDTMQEEEMEMEEDMSVDITTMLLGSYVGINTFGEGGSFITEEDRTATVTMVSDSVANIRIATLFGDNPDMNVTLSSETEFTAEGVSILGEQPYAGAGMLSGDSLSISLTNGDLFYTFVGVK